jgi:hypothetical protein
MIAPSAGALSQSSAALSLDAISAAVAAALAEDQTPLSPESLSVIPPALVPTRSNEAGDAESVGAAVAGRADHPTRVTTTMLPRRRPLERTAAGQLGPSATSVLHL